MQLAQRVTAETIALAKAAMDYGDDLAKAGWTSPGSFPNGIQNWDLEAVVKSLFPVITPLRNRIPRLMADGGVQANWKAITGVNVTNLDIGVSDGNRGGVVTTQDADYFAIFRECGLEDFVTWAAQLSAQGFLDASGRSMTNLLWALMLGEEQLDIGGNTSLALGTGNTPSAADVTTGGSINASTTVSIRVAPLTLAAFNANGGSLANGVRGLVTRNNADGSQDTYGGGTGKPSTATSVTTSSSGNVHSISASTAVIEGAVAYAWFWGPSGSEVLGAITTINSLVITTAAGTGTQLASSLTSDNSTNSLVYDGILTQIVKSGAGYFLAQPTGTAGTGTPLTADGAGGVVEIDNALQWFWDNFRLSPDTIWVGSQEQKNITKKVLQGSSNGAQRFVINTEQGNVKGGDLVTSYLNKFTMNGAKSLAVKLHPNIPNGTIMFDTETLPYPLSNVSDILVKRLRRDYNSTMWPPRSRKYEIGTYFDGVLQNYFPPAFGTIANIANG